MYPGTYPDFTGVLAGMLSARLHLPHSFRGAMYLFALQLIGWFFIDHWRTMTGIPPGTSASSAVAESLAAASGLAAARVRHSTTTERSREAEARRSYDEDLARVVRHDGERARLAEMTVRPVEVRMRESELRDTALRARERAREAERESLAAANLVAARVRLSMATVRTVEQNVVAARVSTQSARVSARVSARWRPWACGGGALRHLLSPAALPSPIPPSPQHTHRRARARAHVHTCVRRAACGGPAACMQPPARSTAQPLPPVG